MPNHSKTLSLIIVLTLALALFAATGQARQLETQTPTAEPPGVPGSLDPDWKVAYHAETGKVRFLSTRSGAAITQVRAIAPEVPPEVAARLFLESYGELFGLRSQSDELEVKKASSLESNPPESMRRAFVRFQQVHEGIPVMGGELIVGLDARNDVLAVSGEVLPDLAVTPIPHISADAAADIALSKVAKDYGVDVAGLAASSPELWIYNPLLLGAPGPRLDSLVWRMDVTPVELGPIRELVLVDAHMGAIVLHFNQVDTARNRLTYDANNNTFLPGTLVCNESNPSCSGGDTHEEAAHQYAGDTYDFFLAEHGRDSIDNAGMSLISSVHYDSGYENAFWNGAQMVYGDGYGFPLADDVVAHELTHGVTEHESNLFYFYQSGAINESLSDVWGEFVDLYRATGNDGGDLRWAVGEDITGLGAIRNMQNPPMYGDPDRMTSANYFCNQSELYSGSGDNGGVHYNSGVNNKAVYLMTDGGSFNGHTVTGLGYAKVADLYYEVQTHLLTSAADYPDLYNALLQACGYLGYSTAECQEVKDALDGVEMNQSPACPATQAPVCAAGQLPVNVFFDDIESGSGNWTAGSNQGSLYWFVPQTTSTFPSFDVPYATSGVGNIWGFNQGSPVGGTSNTFLALNHNIPLPANAWMHFQHSFGFESSTPSGTYRYDGGIVEYSTNSGSSWSNAGALFTHNGYNGTLEAGNPLGAIPAFSADSRGYISSKLDLSTLAGQNLRIRFRIGTDSLYYDYGWFIDDVRIYTCEDAHNVFIPELVR